MHRSTTPHYGPKNSLRRSDARDREAQVRAEAEHTHALLVKLKQHLDNTVQPQLDRAMAERDELAFEVDRLDFENEKLRQKLEAAEGKLSRISQTNEDHSSGFNQRMDRILEEHKARLEAETRAHALEMKEANEKISRLEARLGDSAASEAIDVHSRQRIHDLENALRARDNHVRSLQQELAETQSTLSDTERRAVEVAPIVSAITTTLMELKTFVDESADAATNLVSAASRAGIDGSNAANSWKALQASVSKIREGVPVRALLDELRLMCVEMRSAARQESAFIAQSLKAFVLKQQELTELLSRKEHERQVERDLSRRRLEEVEKDRQDEREALLQQMEKEKMRIILQGGNASSSANSGGNMLQGGSSSPSGSPKGIGGTRLVVPSATTAVQTGTELLEGMGPGNESLLVARLRNEIKNLSAQVVDQRQTLVHMERQRSRFMAFVGEGDAIEHQVLVAMNGSSIDFSFGPPVYV